MTFCASSSAKGMDITMNEIFKYEVGQTIENFRNHQEGVQFDMSDSGATLLVFFNNPTQDEIEQFKAGKNFEIRFTELYGIIMGVVQLSGGGAGGLSGQRLPAAVRPARPARRVQEDQLRGAH